MLGFDQVHSEEIRSNIAKLGLAAVLACGLFDGFTYTTFFVMAFLGYEKTTGKNPSSNLQALLGVRKCLLLVWDKHPTYSILFFQLYYSQSNIL